MIQSLHRLLASVQSPEDHPRQYYELKKATIDQQWSQIEREHYAIWELTDDPITMGYNVDEYLSLEEEVQQRLVQLSIKIDHMSNPAVVNSLQQDTSPALQLPKITLPRFDGDYLKWRQFYDLFSQMVHNQPLSNCQKMWYLKGNLVGEAEKLIRHLSLTEDNYTTAWKMLQDRYNNERVLVATLISKLLGQPSHVSENASSTAIKTLHDTTQECLLALENLGVPTTNWDPLLLHILVKKLDKNTHTLYEQSLSNPKKLQTIKDFLAFLEIRFQSLEALGTRSKAVDDQRRSNTSRSLTSIATTTLACVSCKGNNHQLFQCKAFLKLTPSNRLNLLKRHNLCINCLRAGHNATNCTLRGCTKCNHKHNTLVHKDLERTKLPQTPVSNTPNEPTNTSASTNNVTRESSTAVTALSSKYKRGYILLSTARVRITSHNGNSLDCRAILDSGSQINIISQRCVKRLGLVPIADSLFIEGVGQGHLRAHQRVNVLLQSRLSGYSTRVEAFVLQNIISPQPTRLLDISKWAIPHNIQLADPTFNHPNHVDLLLGAEFYHQLLTTGQIKLAEDLPILQNTALGWIISGKVARDQSDTATCGVCSEDESLDNTIEKFWRLEEVEDIGTQLTAGEKRCEAYYNQTVRRDNIGRFIVSLPFVDNPTRLGESKDIAHRRFFSLERRLAANNELKKQYVEFMEEYLRLGHMEEVDFETITSPYYFLPHHSVHKPDSTTTKLRVVFDASAKTSSNLSLNDVLHTGPTIQDDLFSILLRFRTPRFVFTADIEKMYRQVLVQQEDRKYQLILWRNNPTQRLRCYQLCTVTYGTRPAPYLATKCLQKLARDGASKYPLGSFTTLRNFYVDDVMTGSNSLSEAIQTQSELNSLLSEGGFKLRKWCANHPRLLQNILPEDQAVQLNFAEDKEEKIKTLGLTWLPKSDQFCVKANWIELHKLSKRTVASHIARLFDPLGIMSPVVVSAKIFLQQLWQLKLDWDASLPTELQTKWIRFQEDLKSLNDIHFPRHVFANEVPKTIELHAFADASEKAYGAAIYTRALCPDGRIIVRLLCAKSRVAPVKKITLPRLELCAAKLAAELIRRVKRDLNQEDAISYFWTDSEIVLSWINSTSSSYHTFVANRIAAIQELTNPQQWRHVSSKLNPADVLSRGTTPEKLKTHNLWFYGPPFLHGKESLWPPAYNKNLEITCDTERKRTAVPVITTPIADSDMSHPLYRIQHGNSFRRLHRVAAYIFRFTNRIKTPNASSPLEGSALTTKELDTALVHLIQLMQQSNFRDEIHQLKRYKDVNRNSTLSSLAPFLDEHGLIRVGGRLEESTLSYDAKHPILLPYSHQWTKLLLTDIHKQNHHCGPQTLLAITKQRYWPIKGKSIARSVVQHCVRCARTRPKLLSQVMGNLPSTRVQPARPFINSGVDFCGPIYVHYRTRGKRPQKAYVAVFCCFATKAVHLEVVGDLTTDAFLAALRRFIGRRGHCQNLYCDNATNFVGARNQLNELTDAIYSDNAQEQIASTCTKRGINFHFIPPRAPHFGGLWEAAVKSAKHLLQRSVAAASLTYEELETIMVEIEAILNSRPLTPMSADPNDLTALTPGHFLIGEPLTASVDPLAEPCRASLLTRWKLVSHIKHEFWRRWSREYLNELQHRYKWRQRCENIQPGAIVLLKEDNIPVMKWPLGRIVQIYKGNDGYARVVDVRTATGILRRPIHRLSPLPVETECNQDVAPIPLEDKEPSKQLPITGSNEMIPVCPQAEKNDPSLSTSRSRDDSYSPRKKARMSLGSLIASTWLVCLVLPVIRGNIVEVSKFDTQPGIHFEHLGSTRLISTEWDLVVYYDLQPYWMEFDILANGTQALEHLCNQIKQQSLCRPVITQFQHTQEELRNDNELLSTQATSRVKRGVLNIVGNIANSLFGVLDSQYAEDMAKTIDTIKENEIHLLSVLKNQTSIIDSTINIVKREQAAIDKRFRALESQLSQVVNRIRDTSGEFYQSKLVQLFSSLSIQMTLITSNLQRIHSSIVDTLIDSRHDRISPLLLSPAQLRQEILFMQNHLPPSLRLPASQENIAELYKLMSVEGRAINKYVIVKLKVPLINQEEFDLFKVLPIPLHVNNTFVAIRSCSSHLAITPHRDQYYPLTDQELTLCRIVEENIFLCKQRHPVYQRRANICTCESDFLNGISNSRACKLHKVEDNPIWIQLTHANQWIYALSEKTLINVVCRNETTSMSLDGSGLLKIQPDCTIKHELVTLQGHYIYPSALRSRTSYTRLGDLLNITTPERLEPILLEHNHYYPQWKKLTELQQQLEAQRLEFPNTIHTHTTHSLVIGYIGLLFTIVVIVWLLCKFRQDIGKCYQPKPKPRPRQQHHHQDFVIKIEPEDG